MEDTPTYGTKVPAIYQSLKGIMDTIDPIGKDGKNTFHKFDYRSIDKLMNELHPIFKEHSVIIVPAIHSHEIIARKTNKGEDQYYSNMVINYRLVSTIDGSEVSCLVPAGAADNGDKHFSKALSMGLKYMLNQMFLIPTGDPDSDSEVHDNSGSYKEEKPKVPEAKKVENNEPIFAKCNELYTKHRDQLRPAEVTSIPEVLKGKDVERVKKIIAFLETFENDPNRV